MGHPVSRVTEDSVAAQRESGVSDTIQVLSGVYSTMVLKTP